MCMYWISGYYVLVGGLFVLLNYFEVVMVLCMLCLHEFPCLIILCSVHLRGIEE